MTNKLKWCLGFAKAVRLRGHKKYRIRRKNINRTMRLKNKAFRRWGCFPLPPEWQ